MGKDHVRDTSWGQIKTGFVYVAKGFVMCVVSDGEPVSDFEHSSD